MLVAAQRKHNTFVPHLVSFQCECDHVYGMTCACHVQAYQMQLRSTLPRRIVAYCSHVATHVDLAHACITLSARNLVERSWRVVQRAQRSIVFCNIVSRWASDMPCQLQKRCPWGRAKRPAQTHVIREGEPMALPLLTLGREGEHMALPIIRLHLWGEHIALPHPEYASYEGEPPALPLITMCRGGEHSALPPPTTIPHLR